MPLPCIPALALSSAHSTEGTLDPSLLPLPLPLPTPLVSYHLSALPPLGPSLHTHTHTHKQTHNQKPVTINDLITNSATSKSNTATSGHEWDPCVLICRYVGFPLILDKCPYLKSKVCVTLANEKLQRISALGDASGIRVQDPVPILPRSYKEWALQLKQKEDNASNITKKSNKNENEEEKTGRKGRLLASKLASSTPSTTSAPTAAAAASNPLSCASRHWARACREAMLLEWRRGACAEWRVVNELMSSDRVTKVSNSKKEAYENRNKSEHIDESNPLIATKLYVDSACMFMFMFASRSYMKCP